MRKQNNSKEQKGKVKVHCYRKQVTITFFIDKPAIAKLNELQGVVSPELYEMMLLALAGFCEDVQMILAECWVDSALNNNIGCTCCLSIDNALEKGYCFIAIEKGIDMRQFVETWNKLITLEHSKN